MNFKQKLLIKIKLKRYRFYVLSIICGSLVAILDITNNNFMPGYKKCVKKITLPVKKSMNELVGSIRVIFNTCNVNNIQLLLENKNLKARILELENKNKELIKQCKYERLSKRMTFQVLGFEQNIFKSSLLTEATDELKPGYVATTIDGLVGLVTDVSSGIAQILTITDRRFSVPVKTKSNVHIIMTGNDCNMLTASVIQQSNRFTANIKIGDVLYTSGEGGIFPCGIPIAKVTKNRPIIVAQPIVNIDRL